MHLWTCLDHYMEILQLEVTQLKTSPRVWASPSIADVSHQSRHRCGDYSQNHMDRRLAGQGPHCAYCCANSHFFMHYGHFAGLAAWSQSWIAAFAQCCTKAINPAPERGHTQSSSQLPIGHIPSSIKPQPIDSALASWHSWDTHANWPIAGQVSGYKLDTKGSSTSRTGHQHCFHLKLFLFIVFQRA